MKKKFNHKKFIQLTELTSERIFENEGPGVNLPFEKLPGEYPRLLKTQEERNFLKLFSQARKDFKKFSFSEREKLLKEIFSIRLPHNGFFDLRFDFAKKNLEDLWQFIKMSVKYEPLSEKDPRYFKNENLYFKKLSEWTIEALIFTNGSLIIIPEVAETILDWKIFDEETYLKRFREIFLPGQRGGSRKKWPTSRENECFARIHEKIITRKLSISQASKLVAKELNLQPATLEKKYKKKLDGFLTYLTPEELNQYTIKSLI